MDIKHVNEDNFKSAIKNGVVLVDFSATWCGPCKMLLPVLEKLKNDIQIIKVDVDESEKLAIEYGVMSVPTLMIFKDGEVMDVKNGFMPEAILKSWIDSI